MTRTIDLKSEINKLINKYKQISAIYIFGSRAYNTGSLRSDIDLLIVAREHIHLHYEQIVDSAIDLFLTVDKKIVTNSLNGSFLTLRNNEFTDIIKQIDAKLLWDSKSGFEQKNIDDYGEQKIRIGVDFKPSILPNKSNIDDEYLAIQRYLDYEHLPNTLLGINTNDILNNLSKIIKDSVEEIQTNSCKLQSKNKAKFINSETIKLNSEFDFQNYIHIILKPWIPSLKREEIVINIAGNNKKIDFSFGITNNFLIEAKYIGDNNDKNQAYQDIQSLKNFYMSSSNTDGLLFVVLYEPSVPNLNIAEFKNMITNDKVKIEFINNKLNV